MMFCERLERRTLLAASLSNGTLTITGTAGHDEIDLFTDDGFIEIWMNEGDEDATFPASAVQRINLRGLAGDDWFVIDVDGGTFAMTSDGGAGEDWVDLYASEADDVIYAGDGWARDGDGGSALTFVNHEYFGVFAEGGNDAIQLDEVHSINTYVNGGDGTTDRLIINDAFTEIPGFEEFEALHFNVGQYAISQDMQGMSVLVTGTARVEFLENQHLGTLLVGLGGGAWIGEDGADFLRVNHLAINDTGMLDLGRADLFFDSDPRVERPEDVLEQVSDLIASSRNGGAVRWANAGITSDVALRTPHTTLAAIVNDRGDGTPLFPSLRGELLDTGTVIVRLAKEGDVNFDGRVNADDYFRIDQGFLAQPAKPAYVQGDFNYDGRINADDYFLIDASFLASSASAPAASATLATSATAVRRTAAARPVEQSERQRKRARARVRGIVAGSTDVAVVDVAVRRPQRTGGARGNRLR